MILVTGGAGFIGSHLLERLALRDGKACCAVDDFNDYYDPALKRRNFASLRRSVPLLKADIRNRRRLEAFFRLHRPDTIVHLAARAGVRPSLADPLLYESVNCGGTLTLLELARIHGVKRFVFASSSSVYGASKHVPFREDDPVMAQSSPYGVTKRAGELFCSNYAALYGLSCICLRFFTAYGPRQRPDMAIHKFARLMLDGKPVPVFGSGRSRRDYTYIDDIVQGVRAACGWTGSFEIVNLGESRTVSLSGLLAALEKALGVKAKRTALPDQPGDVPVTWADVSRARGLLRYRPTTPLETGLARFASWLRRGER
ncbi:MAG: NAD-dependent epimerase/dehydratase family protein [Candidatus Brocadiae bacterium]|nr:NAD-dependent epimerase/dehydratase family protein [Candidatus Brocadiia bacterium]